MNVIQLLEIELTETLIGVDDLCVLAVIISKPRLPIDGGILSYRCHPKFVNWVYIGLVGPLALQGLHYPLLWKLVEQNLFINNLLLRNTRVGACCIP